MIGNSKGKTMTKTLTMFREVVKEYNTTFNMEEIWKTVQKYPNIFNIEHLVELTMAETGGYEFIDAEHCDFSDGSECKTGSISPNSTKPGMNTYRWEISNVVSSGGTIKSGPIRLVLYNPHTDKCTYYFIPETKIESLGINYHPTTKMGRIFGTWNKRTNRIPKLDNYELPSFSLVAKMPADYKTRKKLLNKHKIFLDLI